jgi:hypothetical protein
VLEARLANAKTAAERERAILSLKVIDPAAGSGHFLLAAARRLAQELARVRTGESEPPPAARREALRDVVRSCLYAVDKNRRAADLAKVALWIESLVPGVPLSFLDPHIRRGDSLLGVFALEQLARGIPDAAYAPLEGDDRAVARRLRERNRKERGEDRNDLFFRDVPGLVRSLAAGLEAVAAMPERTLEEVQAKRAAFRAWQKSPEHERLKLACDLWCAAFFLPKRAETESSCRRAGISPKRFRASARGCPRRCSPGSRSSPRKRVSSIGRSNSRTFSRTAASTSCSATRLGSGSSSKNRSSSPAATRRSRTHPTRPRGSG